MLRMLRYSSTTPVAIGAYRVQSPFSIATQPLSKRCTIPELVRSRMIVRTTRGCGAHSRDCS